MRLGKLLFALVLGMAALTAKAGTVVVTFDDVPSNSYNWMTGAYEGYAGADWTGKLMDAPGVAVSGSQYFWGGDGITAVFANPIVFLGTYYEIWGLQTSQRYFDLFLNGSTVYESPYYDDNSYLHNMTWLSSNYSGPVDKVVFYGFSDGIVIDNFTYRTVGKVAEPAGCALLMMGIALIWATRRNRIGRNANAGLPA